MQLSNQMPVSTLALSVRNLTVHRGKRLAVANVNIDLDQGQALAVLGSNGSGKSTLVDAIMGLVPISHGSINRHNQSTALVLQSTDVDRSLPITVGEAVRIARYSTLGLFRRFGQRDVDAVNRAMSRMFVDHLALRQLNELSGGQRQRALVAQALAQEADILLLDEPTAGLDLASRKTILDVISEERQASKTVVMCTHSLDDARCCDRVLLMATEAIAIGTPTEVIEENDLSNACSRHAPNLNDSVRSINNSYRVN